MFLLKGFNFLYEKYDHKNLPLILFLFSLSHITYNLSKENPKFLFYFNHNKFNTNLFFKQFNMKKNY
jgi:hypothetical protein